MDASLEVARRFGANLRRARRRTGLSQEEVGFRASLHRTEIGLLERGARVPRIDTLVKVSAAVGVRVDCALLEGIAWNPGSTSIRPGAFTAPGRVEVGANASEMPPGPEAG
jgi:transcriptional regulator with XRE-family HTH domain